MKMESKTQELCWWACFLMAALWHLAWLRANFPVTVQLPLLRFGQKKSDSLLLGCPVIFSAGCCFPNTFSIHFNPPSLVLKAFHGRLSPLPFMQCSKHPPRTLTLLTSIVSPSFVVPTGGVFYQDGLLSPVNVPSISLPHFLFFHIFYCDFYHI